jgi:hypothetical protein
MKGYDLIRSLGLNFVVILFLPSNPFSTRVVHNVNCLSAQSKFSSNQKLQHHQEQLKSGSDFVDEVCQWLDRQPQVSYIKAELPLNILTAFPTMTRIGNNLIELERQYESFDDKKKTKTSNIIALHLISTPTRLEECLPPKFQKDLTDYFNQHEEDGLGGSTNKKEYSKIIHLHQDIWNYKREIVHHRLMAQLGLGVHAEATMQQQRNKSNGRAVMRRIFARKTMVRRIHSSIAMEFLDEHHLWGATKAKHNYGLFVGGKCKNESNDSNDEELVAVATFSAKRKIVRLGKPHRSHELLRFCSKRDSNVVGGISKLIKAFVREKAPDDIVTVVDRDWGDGSGWHPIGFHTVATMDPIVMAVCALNEGGDSSYTQRRHLVGAGIKSSNVANSNDNTSIEDNTSTSVKRNDRIGLSTDILQELDSFDSIEDVLCTLSKHEHFPVYDTGVERLMKVISYDPDGSELKTTNSTIVDMWQNSQPTYAKEYYSPNLGITTLLKHTSMTPSTLPLLIDSNTIQ